MINGTQGQACVSNLNIAKKKDVVVVGGGPAGCAAALSARRNGADTLLIERESYLGSRSGTAPATLHNGQDRGTSSGARLSGAPQARSITTARPWPTPMHRLTTA